MQNGKEQRVAGYIQAEMAGVGIHIKYRNFQNAWHGSGSRQAQTVGL